MVDENGKRWRPVIAALANPVVRVAFGLLAVGGGLDGYLADKSPSRRRHIVDALTASGIVRGDDQALTLRAEVFAEILADAAPRRATGVERFLVDGRIAQYPGSSSERDLVLQWVAVRVLAPGETVSEAVLNGRLRVLADDTALLRRYLVDAGLVERRQDGSEYALSEVAAGATRG